MIILQLRFLLSNYGSEDFHKDHNNKHKQNRSVCSYWLCSVHYVYSILDKGCFHLMLVKNVFLIDILGVVLTIYDTKTNFILHI